MILLRVYKQRMKRTKNLLTEKKYELKLKLERGYSV